MKLAPLMVTKGNRLEKAVRQLQKNTGLPVDGVVDDRTWFELSKISTIFC
jgi:peptidoglycan hydrolase-like protein with peptidoglycan-binding domain